MNKSTWVLVVSRVLLLSVIFLVNRYVNNGALVLFILVLSIGLYLIIEANVKKNMKNRNFVIGTKELLVIYLLGLVGFILNVNGLYVLGLFLIILASVIHVLLQKEVKESSEE